MEDMVGEWRLEARDNNFDKFLECRRVGWLLRKLMTSTQADVEYKLSEDKGTFTKVTKSMLRTSEYPMPTEGDFCPLKSLSGEQEFGRLTETSGGKVLLEMNYVDTNENAATILHRVEDGKLNVSLMCKDIVCNSTYVKK